MNKEDKLSVGGTRERPASSPRLAVAVPIWNASGHLERCLKSLEADAGASYELILIDDGSSDPGVAPMLEAADSRRCTTVVRGRRRRGFVHRVNQGFEIAGGRDVVLLNTDTQVSSGWLGALVEARDARSADGVVATVTPLSDNAGPFSLPADLFRDLGRSGLEALVARLNRRHRPTFPFVPVGHGFCLYVSRQALARVGDFVSTPIGQGYGSENDFCLRCRRLGMRNVLADNTIVLHHGGGSFGVSRGFRRSFAEVVLTLRYPSYRQEVAEWMRRALVDEIADAVA